MGDAHKFFNLKKLSDVLKIHSDKLYNNFNGRYDSLSEKERDNIARLLGGNVTKFFKYLGYDVTITKAKKAA